jgi:protein TonB
MAFADRRLDTRKAVSVGGVVLIHLAIGYAFISGLALKVIPVEPWKTWVIPIKPKDPPPPIKQKQQTKLEPVTIPKDIEVKTLPAGDSKPWIPATDPGLQQPAKPIEKPAPPILARTVQVKGDRTSWVTTEDYPASSIRDGEEGKVAISVAVGANGRVTSCQITKSSGYVALDEATCRYYAKRARFVPAQTADGTAVESSYADGIRWRLPTE